MDDGIKGTGPKSTVHRGAPDYPASAVDPVVQPNPIGSERPEGDMSLRVCALYPDMLSIYADRGNLMVLRRRCEWRGINFQLTSVGLNDSLDPTEHDLFYIGGGQDRDQKLCARDLVEFKREALHAAAESAKVIFAVCGGYQLLGEFYEVDGERLPGIGLVDLYTENSGDKRLIGNVAINANISDATHLTDAKRVLVGFENHGGRTYLRGDTEPLGRVISGNGNNGEDGTEGVLGGPHGTVVGTYLHGPLLPKNGWFADWLIGKALGITDRLETLDDTFENAAHTRALQVAGV